MSIDCPVCGGDTYKNISGKDFAVYKCRICGLGISQNSIAQKGDYHRDQEYIAEEKLFSNIFQKRINIISKFKKPGSVLEIGCATGLMLSLLDSNGWKVEGVEISSKSAESAKKRGIHVIQEDFLKAKINNKYDLIIFNHTLEHLQSPKDIIKKATSLLKKGGLLYIDLPNFDSLAVKVEKASWSSLLPKEHLWQFTQTSLDILLEQFNMEIIYVNKSSGIWDYRHPIKGLFYSLFSFKKRFFSEIIFAIPSWIVSVLGIGSDLMILSRKK